MNDYRTASSPTLIAIHQLNRRLAELMRRLGDATKAFSEAARPLQTLSELDDDQKAHIGRRLRAAEKELEDVTELIKQVRASAQMGPLGTPMTSSDASG